MNAPGTIRRFRWFIGGLLFLSTVINYLDRQTLSVLAPQLKTQFSWNNSDWALIVISFRVAYALMQTVSGRVLDWLGTRRGLLLTVSWYSLRVTTVQEAGVVLARAGPHGRIPPLWDGRASERIAEVLLARAS